MRCVDNVTDVGMESEIIGQSSNPRLVCYIQFHTNALGSGDMKPFLFPLIIRVYWDF